MKRNLLLVLLVLFAFQLNAESCMFPSGNQEEPLKLNTAGYFEKRGVNLLVFSNYYDGNFSDSKIAGVELIHHGVRTATNGDVRLSATPGQWDPIPALVKREVDSMNQRITVEMNYKDYHFSYKLQVEPRAGGAILRVILADPLPKELLGKAGLNLEFLPSAYFEQAYSMDDKTGIMPLYPSEEMSYSATERPEPIAFSSGKKLVFAPSDPLRRISVTSAIDDLMLFDGRNQAQNGWFVVRSLLPAGKTGTVAEWLIQANSLTGWIREPVIAHSQLGYLPEQEKKAAIELDRNDNQLKEARLVRILDDGNTSVIMQKKPLPWGKYLRYDYALFDFSAVHEEGLYALEYGNVRTKPFRIARDIYATAWHPTEDVFLPVQMDHMRVTEAYRVWHGASHLDDAIQAPLNYEHFDLYAQGPTTDSPFKPGEHIPGLNIGGWFDAGDYDIRTQTHYALIASLVHAWEDFHITRDETRVNQQKRETDLHVPDGRTDILQQIEHGTLALVAQFHVFGHAIPGIIAPDLPQYAHLGDASTNTDNQVCQEAVKPFSWQKFERCNCDDRWAFTTHTSPLDYGAVAALAASSRAMRGYNDSLADECLHIAKNVWDEEQSHPPYLFRFGNTTGGPLESEKLAAATELLITTGEPKYRETVRALSRASGPYQGIPLASLYAIPHMDAAYKDSLLKKVIAYQKGLERVKQMNPFGVFISAGGWAGNGGVIQGAITAYLIMKNYPGTLHAEDVYRGLHYILGTHPGSDISFVSAVGTHSKRVAYGNNRADFTFIAGGVVPGVLLLKPDFPENKEDWPFLWGENEYVVNLAGSYIYLMNAANEMAGKK